MTKKNIQREHVCSYKSQNEGNKSQFYSQFSSSVFQHFCIDAKLPPQKTSRTRDLNRKCVTV